MFTILTTIQLNKNFVVMCYKAGMSFDIEQAKRDYDANYKSVSRRAEVDDYIENALLLCAQEVLSIARHNPNPNIRLRAACYLLDRAHYNRPEQDKELDKFLKTLTDAEQKSNGS